MQQVFGNTEEINMKEKTKDGKKEKKLDRADVNADAKEIGRAGETRFLVIVYALSLIFFGLTNKIAAPISRLFDWAGYGQMRDFFTMLFTGILWLVELGFLRLSVWKVMKRKIFHLDDEQRKLLPGNRIAYIVAISVLFIFIVSLQTHFRVKLVYDFGEKISGYELFEHILNIFFNLVKIIWLAFLLRVVESMFCGKKGITAYAALLLASAPLGALDIFVYGINLPVTYAGFYLLAPLLYILVERNYLKAYLLFIMLYLL